MSMQGSKSVPSAIGHLTQRLFDEYPIYEFRLRSTMVGTYLPNKLPAFSSTRWTQFSKRHFFYSKPIIYASRCQMSGTREEISSKTSISDLFEELLTKNDPELRYNFVVMGDAIVFARVPHHRHFSYYILCKHIALSNRSTDVRFAGEFWKDENYSFEGVGVRVFVLFTAQPRPSLQNFTVPLDSRWHTAIPLKILYNFVVSCY